MSNKDWTEKLRDRLENHQVAAPDDLWAGIEAGLDAAEGKKGAAHEEPRKRRAVLVPLRRWGVAAAIAALGIVGWQLAGSGGGELADVQEEQAYPSPPKGRDVELPVEATSQGGDVVNVKSPANLFSKVGKNDPQLAMADKPRAADALRIVEEILPADEIKQPLVDSNPQTAVDEKQGNEEKKNVILNKENVAVKSNEPTSNTQYPILTSPSGKDSHLPLNRGIRGSSPSTPPTVWLTAVMPMA